MDEEELRYCDNSCFYMCCTCPYGEEDDAIRGRPCGWRCNHNKPDYDNVFLCHGRARKERWD